MEGRARNFVGIDLGGGKGKTTGVATLSLLPESTPDVPALLVAFPEGSLYDEQLIAFLLGQPEQTIVAIDAPMSLPVCVRCTLPTCPQASACAVPEVAFLRKQGELRPRVSLQGKPRYAPQGKPRYTPYTQRITEIILAEEHGILPRETLGQGMGPLTARMAYLRRALQPRFVLQQNLLEVYPKATLAQLFPDPPRPAVQSQISCRDANGQPVTLQGKPLAPRFSSKRAELYKRSGDGHQIRQDVLRDLPALRFGGRTWQERVVQNDHLFDAVLCAYTAFLWSRGQCEPPPDPMILEDGWIWIPRHASKR